MTGKNDPFRSLGIRSSTSPAWVASNRSRAPLRSVVRDPVRSYLAAPIRSVASASIRSCMTIRTDSRTRSTPSPVRNASSSSDTADWDKAIGGFPSVSAWPYTPKISPMAAYFTPPRRTSNPTTPRDAYVEASTCLSEDPRLLRGMDLRFVETSRAGEVISGQATTRMSGVSPGQSRFGELFTDSAKTSERSCPDEKVRGFESPQFHHHNSGSTAWL